MAKLMWDGQYSALIDFRQNSATLVIWSSSYVPRRVLPGSTSKRWFNHWPKRSFTKTFSVPGWMWALLGPCLQHCSPRQLWWRLRTSDIVILPSTGQYWLMVMNKMMAEDMTDLKVFAVNYNSASSACINKPELIIGNLAKAYSWSECLKSQLLFCTW